MAREFEIGGLKYELLDIDEFDFDQYRELKKLASGLGMFEVQEAINRGDIDAWAALLLMSIHVKNATFTMDDLNRMKALPVIASLIDSLAAEKEAAALADPPTAPASAPVPVPAAAAELDAPTIVPSPSASASAAAHEPPGVPA